MKMRVTGSLILLIALYGAFAAPVAAQTAFSSTLRLGDSGSQVLLLQQALNTSPDTAVATSGPGSPGMESTYFGTKTLDAVKRYQNKYRAQILVPAGLTSPSGVVGPLTLRMLQQGAAATTSANTGSAVSLGTVPAIASTSPLNLYIAAVNKLAIQQGYSTTTLAFINDQLRTASATTTDTVAQFYKEQQVLYQKKVSLEVGKSLAQRVFDKVVATAQSVFMPERAQAATGLPFGGFVTYALPCTCTPAVTSIFVALPAPTPTSNLVLDYVNGTEAFSWHTLPTPTVATLGIYEPGVQSCFIVIPHACIPLPAVGTITPMVGSSLVP